VINKIIVTTAQLKLVIKAKFETIEEITVNLTQNPIKGGIPKALNNEKIIIKHNGL